MTEWVLARFAPHLGEAFAVAGVPGMDWVLAEAEGHGAVADSATHRAFSLVFHGPRDPVVAQQTVTLAHPALGEVALFVTPIGQDADGVSYQAVFG